MKSELIAELRRTNPVLDDATRFALITSSRRWIGQIATVVGGAAIGTESPPRPLRVQPLPQQFGDMDGDGTFPHTAQATCAGPADPDRAHSRLDNDGTVVCGAVVLVPGVGVYF